MRQFQPISATKSSYRKKRIIELLIEELHSSFALVQTCRRLNPKPCPAPMMASLPSYRLHPGLPAFARTGVDYFGPILCENFLSTGKALGCTVYMSVV